MKTTLRKTTLPLLMTLMTLLAVPAVKSADSPTPGADVRFDISFRGGSLESFIAEIHKQMEKAVAIERLNVLIPPEKRSLQIPALELRSVTEAALLRALEGTLRRENCAWRQVENVWVLETALPPDRRQTRVAYVGDLLTKFKIDDVTTAIQTAWGLGGKDAQAELKYHQETKLLIALANEPQLNVMGAVISELKGALGPSPQAGPKGVGDSSGQPSARP